MGERAAGLPEVVEAGLAAAADKGRAASMAAGAAVIRLGAARGDGEEARRLAAEAEAALARAFVPPAAGVFGRLRSMLELAAMAARSGHPEDGAPPPASRSSNSRT